MRNELSANICKIKTSKFSNLIWLRIETAETSIFLCVAYVRPIYGDIHTKENRKKFIEELDNDTKKYLRTGKVVIVGDLNSRHQLFGDVENFQGGEILKSSFVGSKFTCLNKKFFPGKFTCHNEMVEGHSVVDLVLKWIQLLNQNSKILKLWKAVTQTPAITIF